MPVGVARRVMVLPSQSNPRISFNSNHDSNHVSQSFLACHRRSGPDTSLGNPLGGAMLSNGSAEQVGLHIGQHSKQRVVPVPEHFRGEAQLA